MQAFRNETVFWLNFPSWSISVELWAFVSFGILCLVPRLLPFAAVAVILLGTAVAQGAIDPGSAISSATGSTAGPPISSCGTSPTSSGVVSRAVRCRCRASSRSCWSSSLSGRWPSAASRSGYLLPLTFALTTVVFAWEEA